MGNVIDRKTGKQTTSEGRICLLVIIIACILIIQGCSKREEGKAGKVTLRLGYAGGLLSKDIMERVIDNFEKENPSIKVKMEFMEGSYYEKLQVQMAGKTAPDVIWVQDIRLPMFVAKGVFMDLNDFIHKDKGFNLSDYYPQTLQIYKYQGGLYAIPQNCAPLMFQYNMDIFDRLGIKYPDSNWTWAEFLDIARRLTRDNDGNGRIDQYGFTGAGSVHAMAMLILQNGGRLLNIEKRTSTITMPEAVEAVQFYVDLVRRYRVSPRQEETRDNPSWEMYYRGSIGITQFICPWAPEAIKYQKFRWDVVPVPRGKNRKTVFFSDGFAIYKFTEHPEESWQFLKYLVGEEGQKMYCIEHKIFPTLRSVARSQDFLEPSVPPTDKKMLLEAMDHAEFLPILPEFIEIDIKVISKEMDLAFLGNQSVEDACRKIKEGIDELLRESEEKK